MAGLQRMTDPTRRVLEVLLEDPTRERYGLELTGLAGLKEGTLYPLLGRLEMTGWLESRWEDPDPKRPGRPRRHYYKLTGDGIAQAQEALARPSQRRGADGDSYGRVGRGRPSASHTSNSTTSSRPR